MEGSVRGQSQNMNEVYDTIKRVASRHRISEDRATVLLVMYKWDEEKLDSDFKKCPDNGPKSDYFVTSPVFNAAMTNCQFCQCFADCRNLGCGDFCCEKCFEDDIVAKVLVGELELLCPNLNCWKFISHYRIKSLLSDEAVQKYEVSLLQNFQHAKQALKPPTEEDSLLKRIGTQIVETGKDLASAIGENKKELLLVAGVHVCAKVFKKAN